MSRPTNSYLSREAAKEPLLLALHDLNVRITGLRSDEPDLCHCGLVAEVALDALAPTLAAVDRVRALAERWTQVAPGVGDGLCGAAILEALGGAR